MINATSVWGPRYRTAETVKAHFKDKSNLVHYSELAINPEWSGQNSHYIFYLRPVYTKDDNYKVKNIILILTVGYFWFIKQGEAGLTLNCGAKVLKCLSAAI